MWDDTLTPWQKSVVVTVTEDAEEDDMMAEPIPMAPDAMAEVPAPPVVLSIEVLRVLDGIATLVVVFDRGEPEGEAYQLPVGGLTAEETGRYLNGLSQEDLLDLFDECYW